MMPPRAIITFAPKDFEDASAFIRSILRFKTTAESFAHLKDLSEQKAKIEDDSTVLLIDPRNTLLLRDPTSLFVFYEQMNACRSHHCLYTATPVYDPSMMMNGGTNQYLMPGLCMMTGFMLKELIQMLVIRYGNRLHELKWVEEKELKDFVKQLDIEVVEDNQRRFLVYPKYRLDVGSQLMIDDDGCVTYANTNGVVYEPYVLTRCGNGELRSIEKKLGYETDAEGHTIGEKMERWYRGVRSYFV